MVLLLGIFYNPEEAVYTATKITDIATTRDVVKQFVIAIPEYSNGSGCQHAAGSRSFVFFQLFTRTFHGPSGPEDGSGICLYDPGTDHVFDRA